jgi:hypothetical protein
MAGWNAGCLGECGAPIERPDEQQRRPTRRDAPPVWSTTTGHVIASMHPWNPCERSESLGIPPPCGKPAAMTDDG